jgi:ribosome recycling factor
MDINERMDKAIEATQREWAKIRTGIATPSILDSVRIDYYGTPTQISHLANISVPEARILQVVPWERNLLGAIEKAILSSNLGLNPSNDGGSIRISLPILTDERRQELAKQVRKITEEGRIAIRNIRRDENDRIKREAKDNDTSEDEVKKDLDQIQKLTDQVIAKLDELSKEKESDILSV